MLQYDISKVTVEVVSVDPVAVGLDEALPLSSDMTQQLITEVVQIMQGGAPKVVDTIDDKNPNVTKAE